MNKNGFNLRTERTELTAAKSDSTDDASRVFIGRKNAVQHFRHSYWTRERRSFLKPASKHLLLKKRAVRVPIGEISYAGFLPALFPWTRARK